MVADTPSARGRISRIGLISDTHGVLDPRAVSVFAAERVDAIVHAGDIGSDHVLYELEQVAPVMAVLGNCDREIPGWDLARVANTTLCGARIVAIHDFCDLGPVPDWIDVVVCGHTHRPRNEWHDRTLVVNPGSASQRRSQPSRSVAILEIPEDEEPNVRIVELDDVAPAK
jgi:putative phosphoesterase